MTLGLQIKTFKFENKQCDEIDIEVNKFLKNIVDNHGKIVDVVPVINIDGTIVLTTVKYVGGIDNL